LTTIIVAPGQGAQSEGFLLPWIEQVAGFRELFESYSEYSGLDLLEMGTTATEEQIRDTAVAQPLIVAASLASYRTMPAVRIDGAAGHSVGEFTAAAISGVLSDEQAMSLVSVRAKAMAKAAAKVDTGMAAVIGGDAIEVATLLDALELTGANHNGAGQLVAAGLRTDIAKLIENPPEKARVIELKVAGAFHTSFMAEAQEELRIAAGSVSPNDPMMPLWSNQAGQLVSSGTEYLDLLIHQVSNPVRWDLVMQNFVGMAATTVELSPAGVLSGLLKRAVEDCRPVPLRSPQDFEKVSE
jgi:[acyl-carrier-protein] S-malonyltransferase